MAPGIFHFFAFPLNLQGPGGVTVVKMETTNLFFLRIGVYKSLLVEAR